MAHPPYAQPSVSTRSFHLLLLSLFSHHFQNGKQINLHFYNTILFYNIVYLLKITSLIKIYNDELPSLLPANVINCFHIHDYTLLFIYLLVTCIFF